MSFVVAKL